MITRSHLGSFSRSCGRRGVLHASRPVQPIRSNAPGNSVRVTLVPIAALHSPRKLQQPTPPSAAVQAGVPESVHMFPSYRDTPANVPVENTSSSRSDLEWEQVAPNQFERAIDDMERFYALQESITAHFGVQNWKLSNGLRIKTNRPNLVDDVKRAWIALRYKHPFLASQIEGDRWVYRVADEAELDQWLQETFFVHDNTMTSRELYPQLSTQPLKRAVMHFLARTQEIVLQSPHSQMDGLGIMLWYDNFLKELVKSPETIAFGDEAKNLLPALTSLARIPPYSAQQKRRWDQNMDDWLSNMPTVRLAGTANERPGKGTFQWLKFSVEDTQKLLTAAKRHGVTVSSISQAAVTHAARIHGGCEENDSCSTIALYDAREYVDSQWDRSDLVSAHTVATPIKIQLGSFLETARNAMERFVNEKKDQYALTMSPYYTTEFPRRLHSAAQVEAAPRPLPSNAHLTSMGRTPDMVLSDKYEGPAGIVVPTDLWLALDVMTPDVLVAVWTFGGQLTIQADYNEGFFQPESITRYLRLIRQQLQEGLGIELSPDLLLPGQEDYSPISQVSHQQRSQQLPGGYQALHKTHQVAFDGEPCIPLEDLKERERRLLG